MAAKGEMRFPFNDQRKMLTGFMLLMTFAFVVTGLLTILPFPDWAKDGITTNPLWFLLIGAILAIPRFTYYRHAKKDKPLS